MPFLSLTVFPACSFKPRYIINNDYVLCEHNHSIFLYLSLYLFICLPFFPPSFIIRFYPPLSSFGHKHRTDGSAQVCDATLSIAWPAFDTIS